MSKDEKVGKPTEGPWTAAFSLLNGVAVGFHIAGRPHGSVKPVAEAGGRMSNANSPGASAHWTEGELRANAHLLAAAWDMQKALLVAAEALGPSIAIPPNKSPWQIVQDALAKSRGEA